MAIAWPVTRVGICKAGAALPIDGLRRQEGRRRKARVTDNAGPQDEVAPAKPGSLMVFRRLRLDVPAWGIVRRSV